MVYLMSLICSCQLIPLALKLSNKKATTDYPTRRPTGPDLPSLDNGGSGAASSVRLQQPSTRAAAGLIRRFSPEHQLCRRQPGPSSRTLNAGHSCCMSSVACLFYPFTSPNFYPSRLLRRVLMIVRPPVIQLARRDPLHRRLLPFRSRPKPVLFPFTRSFSALSRNGMELVKSLG